MIIYYKVDEINCSSSKILHLYYHDTMEHTKMTEITPSPQKKTTSAHKKYPLIIKQNQTS